METNVRLFLFIMKGTLAVCLPFFLHSVLRQTGHDCLFVKPFIKLLSHLHHLHHLC
uniref:Uncharacterized protein n=1 Tax=Anguilla anguilla TaxID=7936 RepID=A0A0E9WJR0_ANGAN